MIATVVTLSDLSSSYGPVIVFAQDAILTLLLWCVRASDWRTCLTCLRSHFNETALIYRVFAAAYTCSRLASLGP